MTLDHLTVGVAAPRRPAPDVRFPSFAPTGHHLARDSMYLVAQFLRARRDEGAASSTRRG